MNILKHTMLGSALAVGLWANAQDPWLHMYYGSGSQFQQYPMSSVSEIGFSETAGSMTVSTSSEGDKQVGQSALSYFVIGANTPSIRITTDIPVYEIPDKVTYLDGTLKFEGMGIWDDFEVPVKIRGRGNSTWGYPKKPYRIKFNEKTKLGGLKKAKNYALLANYIDPSTMRNVVGFKVSEVIGMDYPNHVMPVNVWLNDSYKGTYMATEKVGFNNGSIDIPASQEAKSALFELDTYFAADDEIAFVSDPFSYDDQYEIYRSSEGGYVPPSLPVRIKDPDAPEDDIERDEWIQKWTDDFNEFMAVIERGNEKEIFEACDVESLVRFMIVFDICCNQELNHPKSTYLYKTEGGKYTFGPTWDFDWALGYQPSYENYEWGDGESKPSYQNPLLGFSGHADMYDTDGCGGVFFYLLCNTTMFQNKFKEVWNDFYKNKQAQFWEEFDAYAELVRPSVNKDGAEMWKNYRNFDNNLENLRTWVKGRIEFINSDPQHGLWSQYGLRGY